MAGRLHIELCRMAVSLPDKHSDLDLSSDSLDRSYDIINDEETGIAIGSTIVCRVCVMFCYNTTNFRQHRSKLLSFNRDSHVGIGLWYAWKRY